MSEKMKIFKKSVRQFLASWQHCVYCTVCANLGPGSLGPWFLDCKYSVPGKRYTKRHKCIGNDTCKHFYYFTAITNRLMNLLSENHGTG